MPWVDMHDMLSHAYRNHYAVGGFRAINLDFIEAILTAAERCRSPVILNLGESAGHGDFELIAAAAESAARRATVPVALHFDRAGSPEAAVRAINHGCNGFTAVAAHESFPAMVAQVRELTDIAHACGVTVEGALADAEEAALENAGTHGEPTGTSVEEARAFVARTHVDCLAVSVGLGNGRQRGRPRLDLERLRRLSEAVQIPLVVHAASAPSDEHCHKLMQHGVAKVNFSSLLDVAAGEQLRANVRGDTRSGYAGLVQGVQAAVADEVERSMHRCGSAGRAAEVLVQCRIWRHIEHVIVYNVEGADDAQVETMMARGREMLATIPGVRRVVTGWAVADKPRYRFCWLIEFTHRAVIDSYREHPLHKQFADNLFRPIAVDRVSVDFEHVDSAPAAPVSRVRESVAG